MGDLFGAGLLHPRKDSIKYVFQLWRSRERPQFDTRAANWTFRIEVERGSRELDAAMVHTPLHGQRSNSVEQRGWDFDEWFLLDLHLTRAR
jgi:hypothetical protein